MSEDLVLCGSELIGRQFFLGPGEVQVIGMVDGDEVQVGMRHFQADYRKPAAIAVKGPFDRMSDRLGKQDQTRQVVIRHIEEPVDLQLGHHQRMTLAKGIDIQEGKEPLIFRNGIRRYFPGDDL